MINKVLIFAASRQPFVFLRGLLHRSIIAATYFDIRATIVGPGIKIMPGTRIFHRVTIKAYSYIGYGCLVSPGTVVGRYASVGNKVILGGGDHGKGSMVLSSKLSGSRFERINAKQSTIIGEDCWLGNGCIVRSDVSLGRGSIIGMGAVVLCSTEPYSVYVGVPAKKKETRLTQEEIQQVENSKWWESAPGTATEMLNK